MTDYWLKLYVEILDDSKMMKLPEELFSIFTKMLLYVKSINSDGIIESVEDAAWKLHKNPQELNDYLIAIEQATKTNSKPGIIQSVDGIWMITNFSKRQGPSPVKERVERYRERLRKDQYYSNDKVTNRYTEADTEAESESEQKQRNNHRPASTAAAVNSFQDVSARDAEHVYTSITGQPSIPNDQIDSVVSFLIPIIASYTDPKKMHDDGLRHFVRWCNTRGKNGRLYSRTNTGWLAWWNESIAPSPGAPEQERIEYTGALCGKGQALKRKAEDMGDRDHEQHILNYRKHVEECRICGGKDAQYVPMPDNIRDKIKELRSKMEVKHETGS